MRLVALLALATSTLVACSPPDADGVEGRGVDTGSRLADQLGRPLPVTRADSVWSYLQRSDYDTTWAYWPGLDDFYGGSEPHGLLLTTYVNETARAAVNDGADRMPAGAIVVKEAYLPDRSLESVAVMYKVDGYDPGHRDWFFARYDPDGSARAHGRVQSCQECHRDGLDYIMTAGFGQAIGD